MQKHIGGLLWTIGFFGLVATANAQTAPFPTATMQFDGTYAFVCQANVNETWRDFHNRERLCGPRSRTPGPLTIVNGQARYTGAGGREFEGTVGPQGELTMRAPPEPFGRCGGCSPGILRSLHGRIDRTGMVHARVITGGCNWDLSWRKGTN